MPSLVSITSPPAADTSSGLVPVSVVCFWGPGLIGAGAVSTEHLVGAEEPNLSVQREIGSLEPFAGDLGLGAEPAPPHLLEPLLTQRRVFDGLGPAPRRGR